MGMPYEDDEDEESRKDKILEMLSGEVDDFAGEGLGPKEGTQGVTVEISVKPHGGKPHAEPDGDDEGIPEGAGEDTMAHILGMCGGGCAMCKGGEV